MGTNSPQVIEFDICGQICPASLLIALREINKYSSQLTDGTVTLLIKTDNRDGTHTIPEAAANMGFRVNVQRYERYYSIIIAKT